MSGTEDCTLTMDVDIPSGMGVKLLYVVAASVVLIGMATVCVGLQYFQACLIPFTIAVLLSYIVEPFIDELSRLLLRCGRCCRCCSMAGTVPSLTSDDAPESYGATNDLEEYQRRSSKSGSRHACGLRLVSAFIVLMTIIGLLSVTGVIIVKQVQDLSGDWQEYNKTLTRIGERVTRVLVVHNVHINMPDLEVWLTQWLHHEAGNLVIFSVSLALDMTSAFVLTLLTLMFILVTKGNAPAVETSVWTAIDSQVRRYMVVQTAISAVVGVGVGTILALLKVKLALVFGILAFLANYIPNIGALFTTLLPLPVLILDPAISLGTGVLAIFLPMGLHFLIGSVLTPFVYSWDKDIELHPVMVIMTLGLWGTLWGIPGMLLSVPLAVVIRILLEQAEQRAGSPQIFGPVAKFLYKND